PAWWRASGRSGPRGASSNRAVISPSASPAHHSISRASCAVSGCWLSTRTFMERWSSGRTWPSSLMPKRSCRRLSASPRIAAVSFEIAVLLSIGLRPASGRSRRAEIDARALEIALGLGGRIHAIHAGDPHEPALHDYLGMGLERLTVLRQPMECDVLPALAAYLGQIRPTLILAGAVTEQGVGSGMLPYLLARHLGLPMLPAAASLSVNGTLLDALQALPRGRRRALRANLPCLVTIDRAAPAPRQNAFGRARRGTID